MVLDHISKTAKILVVEDEQDIRELMKLHLSREGYQVDDAVDGAQAVQKIKSKEYDLFIFDWMLPSVSGLDLARALRDTKHIKQKEVDLKPIKKRDFAILMVTARVESTDIVLGLEAGADDYITKPFEVPVFLARVRALLRRVSFLQQNKTQDESNELIFSGIRIVPDAHDVYAEGEKIQLTPSEYKLLVALAMNQGKVLSRDKLIDLVQGEGVQVIDRTVDTHIFGLRKKLGKCGDLIETVRGVGYRVQNTIGA